MPIAKFCHNLGVVATPGYQFCTGPAPRSHQVARNNEKPKPLKKTLILSEYLVGLLLSQSSSPGSRPLGRKIFQDLKIYWQRVLSFVNFRVRSSMGKIRAKTRTSKGNAQPLQARRTQPHGNRMAEALANGGDQIGSKRM